MGNRLHMRRQNARCTALAAPRDDVSQKFLVIGGYLIASAIIASWLIYLPTAADVAFSPFSRGPQHLTDNAVNRLHKGDRISRGVVASFDARWSAIATIREPASLLTRTEIADADM
jgi:hypothetical protein